MCIVGVMGSPTTTKKPAKCPTNNPGPQLEPIYYPICGECSGALLINDDDDTKFYQCVGYYRAHIMQCPPPLKWNDDGKLCNLHAAPKNP